MRLLVVIASIVGVICVGCGESSTVTHRGATKHNQLKGGSAPEDLRVVEPVTYGNLTIFPVVSTESKNEDRFITLDEGLKAGTVEILELGAGNPDQGQNAPANPGDGDYDQQTGNAANPAPANDDPSREDEQVDSNESFPIDNLEEEEEQLEQTDLTTQARPPIVQLPAQNSGEEINPPDGLQQGQATPDVFDGNIPNVPALQYGSSGAQNSVNTLTVVNRSDKPLYLMPGEIIVGGSQDRTIGRELVIKPDGKPVAIDVYCVEHGRWGGRSQEETVAYLSEATANATRSESVALVVSSPEEVQRVAEEANQGKFIASVGQLNKAARLAVQDSMDQGKVWDEVSVANAKGGVNVASGAFTGNYVEGQAVKRLEPYIENLNDKIAGTENVVGVVVAINGKVETMDVFESTPLFKKLWPKLLKSYALDAANVAAEEDAKGVCSLTSANDFMHEAFSANVEDSTVDKGIATSRRVAENVVTFSASDAADPQAAEMGGFGGGGFHTSAFSQ